MNLRYIPVIIASATFPCLMVICWMFDPPRGYTPRSQYYEPIFMVLASVASLIFSSMLLVGFHKGMSTHDRRLEGIIYRISTTVSIWVCVILVATAFGKRLPWQFFHF